MQSALAFSPFHLPPHPLFFNSPFLSHFPILSPFQHGWSYRGGERCQMIWLSILDLVPKLSCGPSWSSLLACRISFALKIKRRVPAVPAECKRHSLQNRRYRFSCVLQASTKTSPKHEASAKRELLPGGGGGELPSNRLMGMCRWMGSHFHDWIDYNGVAFSTELLEWGRMFSGFWGKNILASSRFGYKNI